MGRSEEKLGHRVHADRHQRLAALAGEGAGVVGQLVALVERRDAQLSALKGQVQLDRQLLESQ